MLETLKEAGLTGGEARVYLAITEVGETTVGKIVDKSGVTKSIIYQILEKLLEKGLISFVIKDKTKYYQAAPPDNLLNFLDSQTSHLQKVKQDVSELIPQLLLKRNTANLGNVTVYEGFKGLMTVYTKRFEVLKKGDEYLNLGLPPTQPKHHHAFWQKDHSEREKRGITAKLLYNQHVTDDVLKNRNSFEGCDARRMPLDIDTPSWILIYKDTVVIAIPQGMHPISIEINNPEVAQSFRKYFSWFWEKSKRFGRK